MRLNSIAAAVALPLLMSTATPASALQVWDADTILFAKPDFTNGNLPANQDLITANVTLARGAIYSLFNAAQEGAYDTVGAMSPVDTEWAFAGLNGNTAAVSAASYAGLNFDTFVNSLLGAVGSNVVGRAGVLHLISDDIYIDIEFSQWGAGGVGGFAYARASGPSMVPLPGALTLLLGGIMSLGVVARGRNSSA